MFKNLWQGNWRGRSPAGDIHQRARNIISPSGGIIRGKFPSRKNGRMIHHEGLLEHDAIYLFETSPLIVRYREQPITIYYPDGARLRRYTPDFELMLVTGETVLVEVKPIRSLAVEEIRHKFDCIEDHMRRSAIPFVILTDKVIREEPRLSSLRWIFHRAARIPPTHAASQHVLKKYQEKFPISIGSAAQLLAADGVDPFNMLLMGMLHCPLNASVDPETILNLTTEANHAWFWIAKKYGF